MRVPTALCVVVRAWPLAALWAGLVGCAAVPTASPVESAAADAAPTGWRAASVVRVLPLAELAAMPATACAPLPADAASAASAAGAAGAADAASALPSWVLVRYRALRRGQVVAAPWPAAVPAVPGQPVKLQLGSCPPQLALR